jgi:hypothetical protein
LFKPVKHDKSILNKDILNKIIKSDWNDRLHIPKKLYGYHYYRGVENKLYCEVIAKDTNNKYISLPWRYGDKDLRDTLKEITFERSKKA